MNVGDLIKKLSKIDPNVRVVIRDETAISESSFNNQISSETNGIIDQFEVIEWEIRKHGERERGETDIVSISFENKKRKNRLISQN